MSAVTKTRSGGYPSLWSSSVVWHLPHDSVAIPADVRDQFVLSEAELAAEILRMTDHATGRLFGLDNTKASVIRAPVSRLVVDVERFPDDVDEPMAGRGMGVIYSRTSDGRQLRRALSEAERLRLLERWFWPHHRRLTDAVQKTLDRDDRCLVVDCHSFPSKPLPYEADQSSDRPDICLGTDDFHTPAWLLQSATLGFRTQGFSVAINRPFGGALVPLSHYRQDRRVLALMVEVNRRLYLDEDSGEVSAAMEAVVKRLRGALRALMV